MNIPTTIEELLVRWHKRLREMQMSHYDSAKPLAALNNKLGIPVVILTTFVGTAVFATLEKEVDGRLKILIGLISVSAAVLSSIQTFLRFSEKAEKHRSTAAKAGSLRREIEQYISQGNVNNLPSEKIDGLRASIDKLAEDAPNIPHKIWQKVSKYLESESN
jgi:hypothetical protein